jgi:hypothetical protein
MQHRAPPPALAEAIPIQNVATDGFGFAMCSTQAPLRSTTLRRDHRPIAPWIKRKYLENEMTDIPVRIGVMRQGSVRELDRIVFIGKEQLVMQLPTRKAWQLTT